MNFYEKIKAVPKEVIEIATFAGFVFTGAIYKLIKLKEEKGVKITITKILTETFMSFFVAIIVYAVFDQFLNFNKFFTFSMCSLAGSISTVFSNQVEDFFKFLFDAGKRLINKNLNI